MNQNLQNIEFEIKPYSAIYRQQLLEIWERSVLTSHDFLTSSDFEEIKEQVNHINFSDYQVFCLTNKNIVLGFVGVADKKVEMLFLDPDYFGKCLGHRLLDYAVKVLHADKLDVNEQNTKALAFYKKYGFKPFARTDKDDQGRSYPLLRMKL